MNTAVSMHAQSQNSSLEIAPITSIKSDKSKHYTSIYLSNQQKAYPSVIHTLVIAVCHGAASSFCDAVTKLPGVYHHALQKQDHKILFQELSSIEQGYCSQSKDLLSQCKILIDLKNQVPSMAHLASDSVSRLTQLHNDYLHTTEDIWKSYCDLEDSSLFCQLCRGLERTFKIALVDRTNDKYEAYLTNMQKSFCDASQMQNQTRKRCKILAILRMDLPISLTTLFTLPTRHEDYINTIDDVIHHFCSKREDLLSCETSHGMRRLYIAGVNTESNHGFEKYLGSVTQHFCSIRNDTKHCRILSILQNGLPPAFRAEGLMRQVEDVSVNRTKANGQSQLEQRLAKQRSEYSQTISHVKDHYCQTGPRDYFCQIAVGLEKNYEYSVASAHGSNEYSAFLMRAHQDTCALNSDNKLRRCQILNILKQDLPPSLHAQGRLMKQQGQYIKTIEDVTNHYCHLKPFAIFCQLVHGLMHQYLISLTTDTSSVAKRYVDMLYLQTCTEKQVAKKRCQILNVLRQNFPGEGMGESTLIKTAEVEYLRSKDSLQLAKDIRARAEQKVKSSPSTVHLQTLEEDTVEERKAEVTMKKTKRRIISMLAQKHYKAPSPAALRLRRAEEKRAASNAVQALEHLDATQKGEGTTIKNLKKESSEAKLVFETATDAVKTDASQKNVVAVQNALKSRVAAAQAAKSAELVGSQKLEQAKQAAFAAGQAAKQMRSDLDLASITQKAAISQETLDDARKETGHAKIQMLLSEVALERLKEVIIKDNQLKKASTKSRDEKSQQWARKQEEKALRLHVKSATKNFANEDTKLRNVADVEIAVKNEVKQREAVLAEKQKIQVQKKVQDATAEKKAKSEDVEQRKEAQMMKRNADKERATKKKSAAQAAQADAVRAQVKAKAEIAGADQKAKVAQEKAVAEREKASKFMHDAKTLASKAEADQDSVAKMKSKIQKDVEQGKADVAHAAEDKKSQDAAAKESKKEVDKAVEAKSKAEAAANQNLPTGSNATAATLKLKQDSGAARSAEEDARATQMAADQAEAASKKIKASMVANEAKQNQSLEKAKGKLKALKDSKAKAMKVLEETKNAQASTSSNKNQTNLSQIDKSKAANNLDQASKVAKAAEQVAQQATKKEKKLKISEQKAEDKMQTGTNAESNQEAAEQSAKDAQEKVDELKKTKSKVDADQEQLQKKEKDVNQKKTDEVKKASKSTGDAKTKLKDGDWGVDTAQSASDDLKKSKGKVVKANSIIEKLSQAAGSMDKIKITLTKSAAELKQTEKEATEGERAVVEATDAESKAKAQLSKQKVKNKKEKAQAQSVMSLAAKKAKSAKTKANSAEKSKADAQKMLDDAGEDVAAKEQATAALNDASEKAAKAQKALVSAERENAETIKSSKEGQEVVEKQAAESLKAVEKLEEEKTKATKTSQAAELKFKAATKSKAKAQGALNKAASNTKKLKEAQADLVKAKTETKQAESRVQKASKLAGAKKAAIAEVKKAENKEAEVTDKLKQMKVKQETEAKASRDRLEKLSSKLSDAEEISAARKSNATEASSAAKKAKKTKTDAAKLVKGLKVQVKSAAKQTGLAKQKSQQAQEAREEAQATLSKAVQMGKKQKGVSEKLQNLADKAKAVKKNIEKLSAEQSAAQATEESTKDNVTETKNQMLKQLKLAKAKQNILSQKAKATATAAKRAEKTKEEAKAEADDAKSQETGHVGATKVLKTSTQQAMKAQQAAKTADAASASATAALSKAKASEQKQKSDASKITLKNNAKQTAATRDAKTAQSLRQKSKNAKDAARLYGQQAVRSVGAKQDAEARLIKATKHAAKAKEIANKAHIEGQPTTHRHNAKVPGHKKGKPLHLETESSRIIAKAEAESQQAESQALSNAQQAKAMAASGARTQGVTTLENKRGTKITKAHLSNADSGSTTAKSLQNMANHGTKLDILIPYYCARPKYDELCSFYKRLKNKGHLAHRPMQ